MENSLDGNAAGGLLHDLFARDVTNARVTCAACGASEPVGAAAAFLHAMGAVVRCRACDAALIRVAHTPYGYWLDMRGVRVLHIREGP